MTTNKTYAEWHAEQMKNPELVDEVYKQQCGYQIELCRMLRGWSVKKLAKRLGVSKATVKAVIAGDVQLSVYGLFQWLRVLGYETKIAVKDLESREEREELVQAVKDTEGIWRDRDELDEICGISD